ncbi:MAG: archaetidylserine decarboxylase [Pseudomonadota bacterium]
MTSTPSDKDRLGIGSRLFIALQYFLPQLLLTRLIGWFASREAPWFKNLLIRALVRGYSINTREAASRVPEDYASLNAFFTRTLRDGARDIDGAPGTIVSPCDGAISQLGPIEEGRLVQAKGFRYSVAELIDDETQAAMYDGGSFMTVYLAPYDYHRVHMPIAGTIRDHRHVPGRLFSVNGATAAAVPRLFSRNERRIFHIDGDATMAMVMVGALNVGSITTTWHGAVTAGYHERALPLPVPEMPLARGETVGWFNMGSTVILLAPRGAGWRDGLIAGDVLRMGERIGALPA